MNAVKNASYTVAMLTLLISSQYLHAQPPVAGFRHIVDTSFAANPHAIGVMVCVATADNKVWTYAAGVSDKATGNKLDAGQPVLTASNTKPYISATVLRLFEQKKLDITDAINKHLPANTINKLEVDGYNTEAITIAHLLSHTSGIDDYVNDDYFAFIDTNKQYKWTRDEQIDRAMSVGKPLAAPGDTFKYADVNYLLLTEIIEVRTGMPFYKAVRELLKYKRMNLNSTWFIDLERKPKHTMSFAHQHWNKYPWDALDLDPSWDLYGGGGIAATPADMALFFKNLFEGKIIEDTAVLAKMYTAVPGRTKTNYCLGLRKITMAGHVAYYHGGFWGTDVIYFPDYNTAIAVVILERENREQLSSGISRAIVELLEKK